MLVCGVTQMLKQPDNLNCDVLLVEDSFDDVYFIKRAWKEFGEPFDLIHVSDGEKARAFLLAEGEYSDRASCLPPRLIVSDLKMPRWDGLQLLRWVRGHASLGGLPFIMLSSSPFETDINTAHAAGANAYFVKPRTLHGFIQLLSELSPFWRQEGSRRLPDP